MTVELEQQVLRRAGIGSFFRPRQLEELGIPYHRLRELEAAGRVERVGWGLYRLKDVEPTERYSLEVRTKTPLVKSDWSGGTEVARINDPLCPARMALHLVVEVTAREKWEGR